MIDLLRNSLATLTQKHTEEFLGDRSSYIGASELASCPRKVVLSKTNPTEYDLSTLLRFKRGHLAEDMIAEAFAENGKFSFEREIEVGIDDPPLKAHLDFLFKGKTLGVLEVKSVTSIPETPYENWELQLHAQMGLLSLTKLDMQIKGAILAIDLLNGGIELFNGYTPNKELFQGLLQKAEHIWSCLKEGQEPDVEPSPLCAYCDHKEGCPAFEAEEAPEEIMPIINDFLSAKEAKKKVEQDYKEIQKQLLSLLGDEPIKAGEHVICKKYRTSSRYDYKGISKALEAAGRTLEDFKTSGSYPYIYIK